MNLLERIPPYSKKILAALEAAGFEAYLVGGAVRDLLLNLTPEDYDITTNARPEQVLELCRKLDWFTVDNLGNNFGCVVIVLDGVPTEVTTFRGESYGSGDAHRPEKIWYCHKLEDDLSRRDFTVNAMAMDLRGKVYDYFGGQQDLQSKILRTVGNAAQRYQEDGLRMLRACRFVAQLGFTYVQAEGILPAFGMENTPYYMPQNYKMPLERCCDLSLERVRIELDKLLLSKYAGHGMMLLIATGLSDMSCRVKYKGEYTSVPILPELRHLVSLPQNPKFHCYDVLEHTLFAIDNGPRDLAIRWALVLHDLGKGLENVRIMKNGQPSDPGHEAVSAAMAEKILTRLQYPPKFVKLVVWLVAQHMRFAPMLLTGEKTLLRWIRSEATSGQFSKQQEMAEAYAKLVEVFLADMGATHARHNEQLMQEGKQLGEQTVELARTQMPVSASDLNINGKELMAIMPREQIRYILPYLLNRVQSGNLPNEKKALLQAARKHLNRASKTEAAEQEVNHEI